MSPKSPKSSGREASKSSGKPSPKHFINVGNKFKGNHGGGRASGQQQVKITDLHAGTKNTRAKKGSAGGRAAVKVGHGKR